MKIRKLIFWSIALMIFLLITVFSLSNIIINKTNLSSTTEALHTTSNILSNRINNFLKELETSINIMAYSKELYDFSNSSSNIERNKIYDSIVNSLVQARIINSSIDNIICINMETLYITDTSMDGNYFYSKILEHIDELEQENNFYNNKIIYSKITGNEADNNYYFLFKKSYYDYYSSQFIYISIILNKQKIYNLINDVIDEHSYIIVLDSSNNIVAEKNNINGFDKEINALKTKIHKGEYVEDYLNTFDNYIYTNRYIEKNGWKIISIKDASMKNQNFSKSSDVILYIVLLILLLLIGFGFFLNKYAISPILEVTKFVHNLGDDYQTKRLNVHRENEIGDLVNGINRMLDNIHKLNDDMQKAQERIYVTEISNNQARIAALQSQINPHFLYNTLDCIRGMSLADNNQSIANIASSLSKIFRYSIKAENYVMVHQELNCIKEYMTIIKMRHVNRFSIVMDTDQDVLDKYIPKMILQPLIENCVFHGLEPLPGKGEILLKANIEGSLIKFIIEDNGIGISKDELENLNGKLSKEILFDKNAIHESSIGILNIKKRLLLLGNDDDCVKVFSELNKGTKVVLYIKCKDI